MSRFKRAVLWAALVAVIVLTLLSIYGAFLGAERAQAFFNSLPLAVYWFALTALLLAGIAVFRRLVRIPSLLLMHLGSVLVLLGGMWGSQAGHAMQRQLFGIDRVPKGQMAVFEGTQESRVRVEDANEVRELPFSVRLKDFRMEYYQPGCLIVQSRTGQTWKLAAEPGAVLPLGGDRGKIAIRRVFANFRINLEGGRRAPYDAPGGSNPAVEVVTERPDGSAATGFVFAQFAPIFAEPVEFAMSYRRTVRDYVSELEIIEDGKVVAAKDIEVNHPLHYGGYHFYQHSYGRDQASEYTVLLVASDSGLNLVYSGYLMLMGGILWHFWGRRILGPLRTRQMIAPGTDPPSEQHE